MQYECTYANHTSHVGILFDIAKRSKCSTMQLTALGSRKLVYKDDYVRLFSVIRKKKVVNTLINNVVLIYINTPNICLNLIHFIIRDDLLVSN